MLGIFSLIDDPKNGREYFDFAKIVTQWKAAKLSLINLTNLEPTVCLTRNLNNLQTKENRTTHSPRSWLALFHQFSKYVHFRFPHFGRVNILIMGIQKDVLL